MLTSGGVREKEESKKSAFSYSVCFTKNSEFMLASLEHLFMNHALYNCLNKVSDVIGQLLNTGLVVLLNVS